MSAGQNTKWTSTRRVALSTTVTAVRNGPGQLFGWNISNPNASEAYVQLFNKIPGDVTLGTTVADHVLKVGTNGAIVFNYENVGMNFPIAMSMAATTTETGNTAPGTAVSVEIFYQ